MQIKIWYFSGTGQCASFAKGLFRCFQDGHEIELKNITSKESREKLPKQVETEQLILVYPIYANDVPVPVLELIEQLKGEQTPVMLFALWGKCHKGDALMHAGQILSKNGFRINGAAEICAVHTYLLNEIPKSAEEQGIAETEQYIRKRLGKKEVVELPQNKTSLGVRLICTLPENSIVRLATSISLQEENCNHCMACANQCPVGAIGTDLAVDESKCIRCFACVSVCPKKARKASVKCITRFALQHHVKENQKEENTFYV